MKNRNGSAFLYVLLILMLLSSIILAFLSNTLHYIKYASNYKYKNKSYYIAKSGVELATFFISQYGANPAAYQNLLNKTAPYQNGFPILGGYIKMQIVNNDSKFNINQLIFSDNQINETEYAELQRLFYILGIPENVLENIVAFMQKNQLNYEQLELKFNTGGRGLSGNEGNDGADGNSGSTLRSYFAPVSPNSNIPVLNGEYKNPFLNIRDLMLVYNMRYKYYYILKHFLTCNSSGLIDINTAPYQVIESLSPMISESSAQELTNYRTLNPLTSVSALSGVPGFNSSILQSIVNRIEITSDFYLIKSYGRYKSGRTHIKSLYYINGGKYKIYEFIS
jgi:type II secretory pathway component PulK